LQSEYALKTNFIVNKSVSITLKVIGGIIGFILLLLVVAAILLNTQAVQDKLLGIATEKLEEKLQTKVKIDEASINVFNQDVNLKGLEIEDLQHRKMLALDKLSLDIDVMKLLANTLVISKADIEGVRARLYKPEDGPANYQFIIDAFKSDKPKKKQDEDKQKEGKKKEPFTLDIHYAKLAAVDLQYNDNKVTLGEVEYDNGWFGAKGKLKSLQGQWEMKTKKGPQTASFRIGKIDYKEDDGKHDLEIGGLQFKTDNHKPRKNTNKPKRGWFDVGHLDVIADMNLVIDYLEKDTLHAVMKSFVAKDTLTGFNVKDFHFTVGATKQNAHLRDIVLQHENTVLNFDSAYVVLPSKKEGRKFFFQTSLIHGKTLLKDISRPFAKVLQNFKMPLELSVLFSANDSTLFFKDIEVHTPDKRLTLEAVGGIENLKKKEDLDILFHVNKLTAKGTVKEEIINQFAVKKLMMNQLSTLGDITFKGDVHIPYRREEFKGVLGTAAGSLNFDFTHNDDTHYITGNALTRSFRLGKVLKMPEIGDVGVKASFKIDIDKKRTAQVRKKNGGGKMPIGDVKATVYEASYKKIKVKDLLVDIKSNGALVEGNISQSNKGLDWACDFSFTDIDKMSNIKVKPKVKFKVKDLFKKSDDKDKSKNEGKPKEKKLKKFMDLFKKKSKD
jgi:hypothetical protein